MSKAILKQGIKRHKNEYTPENSHLEPKNGGLEDDFPFQSGEFLGSMLIFRGVDQFQFLPPHNL